MRISTVTADVVPYTTLLHLSTIKTACILHSVMVSLNESLHTHGSVYVLDQYFQTVFH